LAHELIQSGFEVFLPLRNEKRQWSDRVKTVVAPLFPSYIFVQCYPHQITTVAGFTHVVTPVRLDSKFAFLSERDIEVIRLILETGYAVAVQESKLSAGDFVKIAHGPFKGLEGRLLHERGGVKFMVELDVLDKTISIEIDKLALEKIAE